MNIRVLKEVIITNSRSDWRRVALIGIAAIVPALITFLMIRFHLDAQITDFRPHYWGDQIGYWHYVENFSEYGFGSGYDTPDELPARIGRFDVHGPAFPVIMGTLAHFTGWYLYSSIYYNMALIALGVVFVCVLGRLDRAQIVLVGFIAATQWLILIFIPSSTQESLHHFGALVLAGVFGRLLANTSSRGLKIGGLIFLFVLALVRLSWALLFVPYLLLAIRPGSWRGWVITLFGAAVLLGVVGVFFSLTTPAGGSSVFTTIDRLINDPLTEVPVVIEQINQNLDMMFRPDSTYELGQYDFGQNVVYVALLIAAAVMWLYYAYRRRISAVYGLHVYNLSSILLLSLVFYLPDGYFRVLGAHLLVSIFLLVMQRNFRLAYTVVVFNLLMVSMLFGWYDRWGQNFYLDTAQFEQDTIMLTENVVYDPDTESAWCNTVLISLRFYDYRATLIPPGVGIAWIWRPNLIDFPLKSRYLMLSDHDAEWVQSQGGRTQLVGPLRHEGALYLNLDADCGADSSASTILAAALSSP